MDHTVGIVSLCKSLTGQILPVCAGFWLTGLHTPVVMFCLYSDCAFCWLLYICFKSPSRYKSYLRLIAIQTSQICYNKHLNKINTFYNTARNTKLLTNMKHQETGQAVTTSFVVSITSTLVASIMYVTVAFHHPTTYPDLTEQHSYSFVSPRCPRRHYWSW